MAIDKRELRTAFSSFATGVTIIACETKKGLAAMTVNSFSSLSLNPPLLLWSIDLESSHFEAFNRAEYFSVNVLSGNQKSASQAFASTRNDQSSVAEAFNTGRFGTPLLSNARANFECEFFNRYDAGDHQIIIGKVLDFRSNKIAPPLIFVDGKYIREELVTSCF